MTNSLLQRTVFALLTNKSGGTRAYGDVVILGTATAKAFTTTTTAAFKNSVIGVVIEPAGIAADAVGRVATQGWIPRINLNTAAALYDFITTHTVAGQGTPHTAPSVAGDFAMALQASSTPEAILFGSIEQGSSGGGGTTLADRRWVRGDTAHARDDEFRDDSINVAWARVDNTGHSGYVTWAEKADSLSVLIGNTGDAAGELHAYLKTHALSIGDYLTCHIVGTGKMSDYPFAGLIISDGNTYGAGNQAVHSVWMSSSVKSWVTATWTGFNTRASFTQTDTAWLSSDLYLKLHYSAANEFKYYVSPDGVQWILLDTRAITMTPSHIGIAAGGWGTTAPFIFSFDYFRVNEP